YELYRDQIPTLLQNQFTKNPPRLGDLINAEVTLYDIWEAKRKNTPIEKILIDMGYGLYAQLLPYVIDVKDWSINEMLSLMAKLKEVWAPELITMLKDAGYTISKFTKDMWHRGVYKLEVLLGKTRVTIERTKKAGIAVLKFVWDVGEWMVETAEDAISESEAGNELVKISTSDDMLRVFSELGITDQIRQAYGLVRPEDLKNFCNLVLQKDGGNWFPTILDQNLTKNAKEREWPLPHANQPGAAGNTGKIHLEKGNI